MSAPPSAHGLVWTDHACRHCGSRLAVTQRDGVPLYECGTCLARSLRDPEPICGCGIRLGSAAAPPPGVPRFRCVANPARGTTNPSVIVIAFGDPAP